MNRFLNPTWPLRVGLGFVNLYAGYYLITDPTRYHKYVPEWFGDIVTNFVSVDVFLQFQGVGELIIALLVLAWFLPHKWARLGSLLLAIEMFLILIFTGIDGVTFRNVGLLGGALALWMMMKR